MKNKRSNNKIILWVILTVIVTAITMGSALAVITDIYSDTVVDNWIDTRNILSFEQITNDSILVATVNGVGYYNLTTNQLSFLISPVRIVNGIARFNEEISYFGANTGTVYRYNLTANTTTDLSTKDPGNWMGNNAVFTIEYYNDTIIFTGAAGGRIGYYNPETDVWNDIRSLQNPTNFLGTRQVLDSVILNNKIYFIATAGILGYYDPIAGAVEQIGISSVAGTTTLNGIISIEEELYIVGNNGLFFSLDTTTNTTTTLTNSSLWGSDNLRSLKYYNDKIYMGSASGLFFTYDLVTGEYTDITATLSPFNFWGDSPVIGFHTHNNVLYAFGGSSRLGAEGLIPPILPEIIQPITDKIISTNIVSFNIQNFFINYDSEEVYIIYTLPDGTTIEENIDVISGFQESNDVFILDISGSPQFNVVINQNSSNEVEYVETWGVKVCDSNGINCVTENFIVRITQDTIITLEGFSLNLFDPDNQQTFYLFIILLVGIGLLAILTKNELIGILTFFFYIISGVGLYFMGINLLIGITIILVGLGILGYIFE